jgi:Ca-activated chloride channel family protein
VDVQVMRGGKPVSGLSASDFELRDNGVRQTIQAVTFHDVPLSVLLVLDTSTSVQGQRLVHLKQAANAAVGALRADDEAALLTFSQRLQLRAPWTRDGTNMRTAIAGMQGRGATALWDAVFTAVAVTQQAVGRTLAIVFTDGHDTASWLNPRTVVEAASRSDLVVYGVSSGRSLEDIKKKPEILGGRSADVRFDEDARLFPYAFLEKLTEATGGEMLRIEDTQDLAAAFTAIIDGFKSRYVLSYTPKAVPGKGWHAIQVKLANGNVGSVTSRRGYMR